MQIKTTITQKGSLNLLKRTFKSNEEIRKLIKFNNVTPLAVEEIKKGIKEGKNLKTLRPVTRKIRRYRRDNPTEAVPQVLSLSKPLYASGALHDSVKQKGNRIEFNGYGRLQAEGFTTASNSMIPNKQVPARNFLVALTSKELASKIQKEISKHMPVMIQKIMRVGMKVKPGG